MMIARGSMRFWITLCAAAFLLGLPATSFATGASCTSDAECGEGFVCESYEQPCPEVDCAPGQDCDTDCESNTVYDCVPEEPQSCASAADCSGDLVCVTFTYESCTDVAVVCAGGEDCDAGAMPDTSCETETEGYCLPPYLAPCDVDADCGAGFSCEEAEVCECSGDTPSAGIPETTQDAGSGDEVDAWAENCSCSGTGESWCQLDEQTCTSDADCPGDLICDTLPTGDTGGDTASCASDPDGNVSCDQDAGSSEGSDKMYCQPDDLERWIDAGAYVGSTHDESYAGGGYGAPDREASSASVDRGDDGAAAGSGSDDAGSAGCSSAAAGDPAGGVAAALLFVFGLIGLRRRG